MQRRGVNNQRQLQLLKYDNALQANELALMTNVLVYVSMSSSKALPPEKCFSSKIPRCFSILLIKYLFSNSGSFSYLSKTNYYGATKITVNT